MRKPQPALGKGEMLPSRAVPGANRRRSTRPTMPVVGPRRPAPIKPTLPGMPGRRVGAPSTRPTAGKRIAPPVKGPVMLPSRGSGGRKIGPVRSS